MTSTTVSRRTAEKGINKRRSDHDNTVEPRRSARNRSKDTVSSINKRKSESSTSSPSRSSRRSTVSEHKEEVRSRQPLIHDENMNDQPNQVLISEEEVSLKENYGKFVSSSSEQQEQENVDAFFYQTKLEDLLELRERVRASNVQLMEEQLENDYSF